jgi:hypothetical protein
MTAEDRLQGGCVTWFRLQYPKFRKLLFAVPNGGSRNKIEAAKLKATGVTPGVADLLLLVPRQGHNNLVIEMKTPTGTQSPEQKAWQKEAEQAGNKYVVCRSIEQFMTTINQYLSDEPTVTIRNAGHLSRPANK